MGEIHRPSTITARPAAELAEGEDLAAASRDLQLALVAQIRAERDRRYPELEGRRWAMWVEEDERAEA